MEHSWYAELWASGASEAEMADPEDLRRMREYQFWAISGPHEDALAVEPKATTPVRSVPHAVICGLPRDWEEDVYESANC